jgi:hypothetical protein
MGAERHGFLDAPGLLVRRLMVLELDPAAVARSEPDAFSDLRRRCAKCAYPDRCERDFHLDPIGARWKAYCPNRDLINFMTTMWWLKFLR